MKKMPDDDGYLQRILSLLEKFHTLHEMMKINVYFAWNHLGRFVVHSGQTLRTIEDE